MRRTACRVGSEAQHDNGARAVGVGLARKNALIWTDAMERHAAASLALGVTVRFTVVGGS